MPTIYKNGKKYCGTSDTARNVNYENTESKLEATTVQEAIDENTEAITKLNSALIPTETITTLPTPTKEGAYFVGNADSTFPYQWGLLEIRYGAYTNEFVATFKTTGEDNHIYHNTYRNGAWVGWETLPTKSELEKVTIGSAQYNTTYIDGNLSSIILRKCGKMVHLNFILCTSQSVPKNTPLCTLPSGYKPRYHSFLLCMNENRAIPEIARLHENGQLCISSNDLSASSRYIGDITFFVQ